jgi:hypothetical protein
MMLKQCYNYNMSDMIKLRGVLFPSICGCDLVFYIIWVESSVNIFKIKMGMAFSELYTIYIYIYIYVPDNS